MMNKKIKSNYIYYALDEIALKKLEKFSFYLEENKETPFYKATQNREVYKKELGGKVYYIKKIKPSKKFKISEFKIYLGIKKHILLDVLENIEKINKVGIETIEVVGLILKKKGFKVNGIIVSNDVKEKGFINLNDYIKNLEEKNKEKTKEIISDFVIKLLQNNIYHSDPALDNFFIKEKKIILSDLDGIEVLDLFNEDHTLKSILKYNDRLIGTIFSKQDILEIDEKIKLMFRSGKNKIKNLDMKLEQLKEKISKRKKTRDKRRKK